MLMDEMRAELRALKKEAGGNSISKMKKADLERQIEVYRGMVADSPAPPRRAEKAPPASRKESESVPRKRVGEMALLAGGKPRPVAKAPARNRIEYEEEEESARPAKSIKAPKVVPKAVAKAASKPPKKMERAVEPEDSGSEFD